MDGREVLAELKTDDALRGIPTIVLTTSAAADDVRRCYELHANAFLTKPVGFDRFREMYESITRFWLREVTLPPHAP